MGLHPKDDRDAGLVVSCRALNKGDDALKTFLAHHYQGAGWMADDIIESLADCEDFYANESIQVKLPSLHKAALFLSAMRATRQV